MMLHKKSHRRSLLKLAALIPIVGLALALNAKTVTHYVYDEPQKQQPIKKGNKARTINFGNQKIKVVEQDDIVTMEGEVEAPTQEVPSDNTFDVVEQMPEFPGGIQAMAEYLMNNTRYPKEAFDKGIQGRVILTFVVEKDGSITEPNVVKSINPSLDAEAVRMVSTMPKWTPGRQKGQTVRVKYTIPVMFKLQGNDDDIMTVERPNLEGYTLDVDGEKMDISMLKEISPNKIRSITTDKPEKTVSVTTYKKSATQFIIQFLNSAREKCKNETGRDLNTQKVTVNGKVMTLDEIEESSLDIRDIGPVVVDKSYNIIINTK